MQSSSAILPLQRTREEEGNSEIWKDFNHRKRLRDANNRARILSHSSELAAVAKKEIGLTGKLSGTGVGQISRRKKENKLIKLSSGKRYEN